MSLSLRASLAAAGLRRRLHRASVALALAAGALAVDASAADVAPGPVVELPKFEVTDSRLLPPPESWRYAQIPGFEILSRISERETKRFVRDFMLLQEVINMIMPVLLRGSTPVPTALILCGSRGKGFEEFLPQDQEIERYGKNSLFFKNSERAAIVIDFALTELQVENDLRLEADPYRAFYAAYFRFLIRRQLADKAPPWFEEGLVQLFAATEFDKKTITFAQIGDGFGAEKIGDFNRMLSQRAMMPFGQMLATNGPKNRNAFWSAQCYAFIHFCLYGTGNKYQRPFMQFVQRLADEEPTEKLFKECFGKTYNQFATELRGYLGFTTYKAQQYRAKKGESLPEPPAVALREASDADVGRIKGEVLRLGGYGDAARNTLIAPFVRGERDPRLLAALGLDEKLAGHDDRARKFLEAASNAKVDRARAYLELARLRLDEVRPKAGAANSQLNSDQVTHVLTPLFTARATPPPMADVYSLIAETWSLSAAPPLAEHLAVVIEGVRRFPRDTGLLMQATLLAAKRGFPTEAAALAKFGVKISTDAGLKDRFETLAAAYERDETKPADAKPEPAPTASQPYLLNKAP
ncbi:hypothetical protein [Horticoccus sp. 23ND18S-11]|uniref:hypothetical protein n=1 Tax=Horticoccus sp. 23ND18S-11 TaxID=3391832 RepID=UPI0039C9DE2E